MMIEMVTMERLIVDGCSDIHNRCRQSNFMTTYIYDLTEEYGDGADDNAEAEDDAEADVAVW